MSRILYSAGGPFPFDRSFRGQNVVQADWIIAARREGFRSKIFAMSHGKDHEKEKKIEDHQKSIAEKAFSSELFPRYRSCFKSARQSGKMSQFMGLEEVEKSLAAGDEVHYVLHYYNSRFQDGKAVADLAGDRFEGRKFSGYYVLHVNPDQIDMKGSYEDWKKTPDAVSTASRLADIVRSKVFRRLIAVSESTKAMWVGLLGELGFKDEAKLAEAKTKAVPNGIDTDLYVHVKDKTKQESKRELGLEHVDKVVLMMSRPSVSKGSDRLLSVLRAFNDSDEPRMKDTGFLVALPDSEGAGEFFTEMLGLKKLLIENRLKVTIDVSKIVRDERELKKSMRRILSTYPPVGAGTSSFVQPVTYPLTYVSDVMLHVPRAEAFGLVVAEALVSGCGVVTTGVGGIPSILSHWPGQAKTVGGDDTRETVEAILASERAHRPNPSAAKALSVFDKFSKVID
ncbi:MAG TPA: glycosyltransferase [Candidatus Bilamarchaeum sp.]|nr:glycosyltransferase [Candidatus Bilamarchaeum sp.]